LIQVLLQANQEFQNTEECFSAVETSRYLTILGLQRA